MAIVPIASTVAAPLGNANYVITAPIDTTGANLIVVWLTSSISWGQLTDSKNNVWSELTRRTAGNNEGRFYYCTGPLVGPDHTFTLTGTLYGTVSVLAFSGVKGFQIETGATSLSGVTTLSTGSVTPAVNDSLVVTGYMRAGATSGLTVAPAGFEATKLLAYGDKTQGNIAYLIQGTAAAINATWSWPASAGGVVTGIAVFNPGAPTAAGRISQMAIEVMALGDPPTARVSQLPVEVLVVPPPPDARLSQLPVEILVSTLLPTAKLSQLPLEVLVLPAPSAGAGNAIWMGDGGGGTIWVE